MEFVKGTDFTELQPVELDFNQDISLGRYTINSIQMCKSMVGNTEGIVVEISLGRPIVSNILTVFIPTITLMSISFISRVFVEDYVDMVVEVNLTIFLVLATLWVFPLSYFSTNLPTQLSWALPDLASDLLREDARHLVDLHHDRPLHRGRHACLQPAPRKTKKGRSNNDFIEDQLWDSKVRFLHWKIVSRSPSSRLCPFLCWILDPWLSGFPLVGQSYSHPSTSKILIIIKIHDQPHTVEGHQDGRWHHILIFPPIDILNPKSLSRFICTFAVLSLSSRLTITLTALSLTQEGFQDGRWRIRLPCYWPQITVAILLICRIQIWNRLENSITHLGKSSLSGRKEA